MRVAIIGAGIAGLACADDLRAAGAYVAPEKEIIALIAYLQHLGKYEDPRPAVASSQ